MVRLPKDIENHYTHNVTTKLELFAALGFKDEAEFYKYTEDLANELEDKIASFNNGILREKNQVITPITTKSITNRIRLIKSSMFCMWLLTCGVDNPRIGASYMQMLIELKEIIGMDNEIHNTKF